MTAPGVMVCRAQFLLPLAGPNRGERIHDGYVLSEGETIKEAGRYTSAIGERLIGTYGASLCIMGRFQPDGDASRLQAGVGERPSGDAIPRLHAVLLPAFVKAHGHDHEQPIIGIAKDEPLTAWLDHAVNPFAGFINHHHDELARELGDSPRSITYRMARLCDIHYGITTSMVHHCTYNKYHCREIAAANEAAGTTMIVAIGGQDRHYVKEVLDRPQDALERLRTAIGIPGLERTSFCPGPDQVFSNSRDMLIPLKAWARGVSFIRCPPS